MPLRHPWAPRSAVRHAPNGTGTPLARRMPCDAVQVHGGNGCCSEYPVEGYIREAEVLEIIEGTSQVQQMIISLHGLRHSGRD